MALSLFFSKETDNLNVRARHEALLVKNKKRKLVTLKEFREAISSGKKWTVIHGSIYDLTALLGNHPGGDFLGDFVGIDSSLHFYISHIKSANVWARLRSSWIGYLKEDPDSKDRLAAQADRELMELIDEVAAKGLFQYPRSHIVIQLTLILGLYIAQILLAMKAFPLGADETVNWTMLFYSLVTGTIGYEAAGFFVHDGGHASLFETKKQNQKFLKWVGLLILNTAVPESLEVHDYHHAFPNTMGRDHTYSMPLFKWHPEQLEDGVSMPPGYSSWAPFVWYGVFLWLYAPVEVHRTFKVCAERKDYVFFTLFLARFAIIFGLPMCLGYSWLVGASHYFTFIFSGYIGAFISTLNHLAEEKESISQFQNYTHQKGRSFVQHQAGKTRNLIRPALEKGLIEPGFAKNKVVDTNPNKKASIAIPSFFHGIANWASGHFNYHIEHHMIPYLPRQNLPLLTHRIREICALEGADFGKELYFSSDYSEAAWSVFYTVLKPFDAKAS